MKILQKTTLALMVVATSASVWAIPITISTSDPGNQGVDNVLFNDNTLLHSGLLVQGNFNGSGSGYIVDFTSTSGNDLLTGGGGQAVIEGLQGNDPFTDLTISLEDNATFTKAIFNVVSGDSDDGTIKITVNYIDATGSPFSQTLALDDNGQNFFSVVAADGALITSINISTLDASFDQVRQVRLGGFDIPTTNVPDGGGSLFLLGMGGVALAAYRRKA